MSAPGFPRPLPSREGYDRRYWEALDEGRIELPRCRACGRLIFYPRSFCPSCHATDVVWEEIAGAGRVYTFSVVHRATHPWFLDKTPYVYAVVELDAGIRLPTTIVGCDPSTVRVGQPVEPVFEAVEEGGTLLFFRPLREA